MVPLLDVYFPFLPLESIQSLSSGLYAAHRKHTHQTFSRFRLHTYGIDIVSHACDWVMPALSAVLLICSFQFSYLLLNISLARSHQHCSVLLVLIRNIGHRTLPKIRVGIPFLRGVGHCSYHGAITVTHLCQSIIGLASTRASLHCCT